MSRKIQRLAEELHHIFKRVSIGHCLRLEDLSAEESIDLCRHLQESTAVFSPYILETDLIGLEKHPRVISIDTAIEKRNKQKESLCLLISSGTTNAALSSLGNTFESFDTPAFFKQLHEDFLKEIPKKIITEVKKALTQAQKRRKLQTEDIVDFLNAVIEHPTLEYVGASLWYLGLIPDKSADFTKRLKLNYDCTKSLVHPLKPHSTIRQRLEDTKLRKNAFMDGVERFLHEKNIEPPAKNWLQHFSGDQGYDLSHWDFPDIQTSNLEEIRLKKPIRDSQGLLVKASGNLLCEDTDSEFNAVCGPKKKILVAWETIPKNVQDVASWQVELMPSKDDYGDDRNSDALPLPLKKKPKQKTAQISLDLDVDNLDVKWVQIRVVGLDENDDEIQDKNNNVIEALSERIYLDLQQTQDIEENEQDSLRPRIYPNLPYGYVDIALNYTATHWNTRAQDWKENDKKTDYFSMGVGNTHLCRIGVSNILHRIETKILHNADDFGRYRYTLIDFEKFDVNDVTCKPSVWDASIPAWLQNTCNTFTTQREKLFKDIREQHKGQGIVANADWGILYNNAKKYTDAYTQLLDAIRHAEQVSTEDRQQFLQFFLSIDTVECDIRYTTGSQKALLLLPTHPHRILWMAAYAALLNDWREQLLDLSKTQRKQAIIMAHLKEITPTNIPCIVPSHDFDNTENWYVFVRNIGFCTALLLPPSCPDWSRVTADILRFLDYQDEIIPTDIQPKRISADIENYLKVHSYCKQSGLKIGMVNPGNAHLFSTAMKNLLIPSKKEIDTTQYPKIQRLEISAIAHPPLPIEIEGLEQTLRNQFYALEDIADNASALYPAFTLSLTEHDKLPNFPNGDQHVSFHFDAAKPKITLEQFSDTMLESISFYGLINRWLSDSTSEEGQLKWRYWLALSKSEAFERHPVDGKFTIGLLALSKQLSQSLAFLLKPNATENNICCLTSIINPEKRAFIDSLHQVSDWVLTIDRFFGAEFFDSPKDPFLAELSKKYVIDYSPDFNEGLGDRLLVTTCWQEELTQIVANKLSALQLPHDEESVLNVITALKSLTGNYVLQLFQEDNQETQKIIAMGITLHHLIKNKRLQGAFLMPIRVHPEVFGDTQEICDFLLIKFDKTNIRIMCIDSILDTVISDDVKNRLDNTTEILCDRYFIAKEQQMLGTPLERSRIVILMRYYFTKAVRYGFITKNDDIAKYNDIFNKIEAGKIQPSAIAKTVYLVSTTQTVASSKPIKDNGMTIITLGSGVLTGETDQNVVMEEEFTYDIPQTSDVKPDSPKIPDIATVHPKTSHKVPEIIIGKTAGMGQDVIWKPSVEGSPHVMIVGIPGQGKSVTLNTLLCRLQENGVGVLALDFHNDFGDAKHSSFARLYHPTIWNAAQGLPFSPLEADLQDEMGQNSWKNQSANLADIFEYVCTLGTQQRYGLLCAITKCYEDVIRRGDNVLPTISELSRKVQRLEKNKEIQNGVMARCHPILDMNVFKPQSEPWDILETTQSGLVINLKDIGSDTVRQATSAFILRKVYQDILTWEKTDVMKLVIVLDEAHRLTKDKTLPLIMQEARKFGVAVIVASQNINHFHENVIGNAGTKILFRTNDPDSRKVSKMVQIGRNIDTKPILENLNTAHALVKTPYMTVAKKTKMDMV